MTALPRSVRPETLDALSEDDPQAMRSRRDLRRLHRVMGTRSTLLRALRGMAIPRAAPLRVLELGAGDGSLLLGVAAALRADWHGVELTLLDRQALVQRSTLDAYAACGWRVRTRVADALEWAADDEDASRRWDLVVANLFVHHFEGAALAALLGAVAARSDRFLACEPRRGWLALASSRLVGAIGCGAVTREDAVLSVHAGFRDGELSALWPDEHGWRTREYAAGLFSHCFRAERMDAMGSRRHG